MTGASCSGAAVAFALFALMLCGPLRAETLACTGGNVTVSADSRELAVAACDALTSARAALAECGLEASRPIAVSIVNAPVHP